MGFIFNEFVDEVEPVFICQICTEVLEKPVQCSEGHTFCLTCIEKWLDISKTCPVDRSYMTPDDLSKCRIVEELISNKTVCCKHCKPVKKAKSVSEKGEKHWCSWTGPLKDRNKHAQGDCCFAPVECENRCGLKLRKDEMLHHTSTACPNRLVSVECNHTVFQKDVENHLEVCGEISVECNFCRQIMPREQLKDEHQRVCANKPVWCKYRYAGCDAEVMRKDIGAHENDTEYHVLNIMTAMNERVKELEEKIISKDVDWTISSEKLSDFLDGPAQRLSSKGIFVGGTHVKLFLYKNPDQPWLGLYLGSMEDCKIDCTGTYIDNEFRTRRTFTSGLKIGRLGGTQGWPRYFELDKVRDLISENADLVLNAHILVRRCDKISNII